MERILFIVPPNITFEAFTNPPGNVKVVTSNGRSLGTVVTDMPLGPLSLSAYVKAHSDAQTRMIDFNVVLNQLKDFEYESFAELFMDVLLQPEWQEYNPTIIGISALFSPCYRNVLDLAQVGRQLFPESFILGGGFIPTNQYKQMFRDSPHFDGLCFAEGEKPLLRFMRAADKKTFLEQDPSWITAKKVDGTVQPRDTSFNRSKGLKAKEFEFDFVKDLDEIPFLDYTITDPKGYALNPTMAAYPSIRKTSQFFHVMTSRGCVFQCSFCAQDTVHGREMRYHSVERIRQDFKRLKEEFDVETIIIEDDHFMGDPQRAYDILGIMIEFGMTAFFPNSLALYALKKPMLERIKAVGVDQLVLAVESGSDEVLHQIMHKPLKLPIISRVTKDCREVGIYTDCNIVMGLPGETKDHIEESRRFLRTTFANWFRINIATPIVGSEMLEICLANDYIQGDYNECDYKKGIVETPEFTAQYIQEMAYIFNIELNFIYNSDVRLGDYNMALLGFNNAIKARPDHFFAHYYAALCHENLGDHEAANSHYKSAALAASNPFWQKYMSLTNFQAVPQLA